MQPGGKLFEKGMSVGYALRMISEYNIIGFGSIT